MESVSLAPHQQDLRVIGISGSRTQGLLSFEAGAAVAEVMTGYFRQITMEQFAAACHAWGVLTRSNMAMDHGEIRTVVCPAQFRNTANC